MYSKIFFTNYMLFCLGFKWVSNYLLYVFSGNRYGYAVASAIHGVGNILRKDFMIQV